MMQQQPARGGNMAGMDACLYSIFQDSARMSVSSATSGPCIIGPELSFDDVDGCIKPELDVFPFTLDSFISYMVEKMSHFHDFVTSINERKNSLPDSKDGTCPSERFSGVEVAPNLKAILLVVQSML
jgi:hypothetical protein